MKKGGFFTSNWGYIFYFIVYFFITFIILAILFNNDIIGLLLSIILYTVSLLLAFSKYGESYVRSIYYARPIKTKAKKYLNPIFNEVYEKAYKKNPHIGKNIKLYYIDDVEANAYAIGKNTICITKGAVNSFSEDELKGLFAHELGHIVNGDTQALILRVVGNGFFSIVIWVINLFIKFFTYIINNNEENNIIKFFFYYLYYICKVTVFLIDIMGVLIMQFNSRQNEYLADYYAYRLGFKDGLTSVLYILSDTYGDEKVKFFDRYKMSHPYLTDRIYRLENINRL
jgi:Zn-dependent protease with chaperone function